MVGGFGKFFPTSLLPLLWRQKFDEACQTSSSSSSSSFLDPFGNGRGAGGRHTCTNVPTRVTVLRSFDIWIEKFAKTLQCYVGT